MVLKVGCPPTIKGVGYLFWTIMHNFLAFDKLDMQY
jgi:hypothetical protein